MLRYILPAILLLHTAHSQTCPPYGDVTFGAVTPVKTEYDVGETITITCSTTDYIIDDLSMEAISSLEVVCESDGGDPPITSWNKTTGLNCAVCRNNMNTDCGDGGLCISNWCDCEDGYQLDGLKTCVAMTCSFDASIAHATVSPIKDDYALDEVVTVTCDGDYHVKDTASDQTATTTCSGGDWDPAVTEIACIICAVDDDCTNSECAAGQCVCNDGFEQETANSCKQIVCPDNYCNGLGDCTVVGSEKECSCIDGVSGDRCDTYDTDPCLDDPCGTHGACTRADPPNVNDYNCACTEPFEGDQCQYSSNFYVGSGTVSILEETTIIKIDVTLPTNVDNMLIAIVKVDDDKKLILTKTNAGCLGVAITMSDEADIMLDSCSVTASLGTARNAIELYKVNNKLAIKVSGAALDYIGPDFSLFKGLVLGPGCAWDDASTKCMGASRVYYTPFLGTLHSVTVGAEKKTWEQMEALSDDLVNHALTCADAPCPNGGSCNEDGAGIACSCPDVGVDVFQCDTYTGVSFNGYTSTYESSATVPVYETEQVLDIGIKTTAAEEGLVAVISIAGTCEIRLTKKAGNKYAFDSSLDFSHDSEDWSFVFDGNSFTIALATNYITRDCAWDFSSTTADVTVELGGDVADTSGTPQGSMFQGCVRSLSINSMPLLYITGTSSDLSSQCVDDFTPDDPCDSITCKNSMACELELSDYSGACDCQAPFIKDALCDYQNYCDANVQVTLEDKCNTSNTHECIDKRDLDPWFFCNCTEGWEGPACEVVKETATGDDADHTTTIIVVVIVAVVIAVIVVILLVRRRKNTPTANGDHGKSGTYSPQEAERGIELGQTNGQTNGKHADKISAPVANIYDSPDVIKNPNVESHLDIEESQQMPPPPPPSPPVEPAASSPTVERAPVESVYPVEALYSGPDPAQDTADSPAPI